MRQKSAQNFQPTALVFLAPDQTVAASAQLFDLRDDHFTPLSVWDAAFIARIMRGELSPGTRHALKTWQALTGNDNPAHCSILADYQAIFGMESIENRRVDVGRSPLELLSVWRMLMLRLERYHHVESSQCFSWLRPVIQSALAQLNELDTPLPMSKEHLRFLFSAALAAESGHEYKDILRLISRHQTAKSGAVIPVGPALGCPEGSGIRGRGPATRYSCGMLYASTPRHANTTGAVRGQAFGRRCEIPGSPSGDGRICTDTFRASIPRSASICCHWPIATAIRPPFFTTRSTC